MRRQTMETADAYRLRRAAPADGDALHALASEPRVYRYLGDNRVPPRAVVDGWLDVSADARMAGLGTWVLLAPDGRIDGAVLLLRDAVPRTAELVYLLHPRAWGRGLATRMAWTVVARAFDGGQVDTVIAGADVPNVASIAVMQRLGMRFLRDMAFPLGAGVQYHCGRGDAPPVPVQALGILQDHDALPRWRPPARTW